MDGTYATKRLIRQTRPPWRISAIARAADSENDRNLKDVAGPGVR
jgi:hypothetical protein